MRGTRVLVVILAMLGASAQSARAEFPYQPQGLPGEYDKYRLTPATPRPNDLQGKLTWMYAATAEAGSPFTRDARELNGVRGAHLIDADATADQAFYSTTGRPDVTIGVTDSGIKWNDPGAMADLRKKTRIARGEAKKPQVDRQVATEAGQTCATFATSGFDRNRDGVFNVIDYACDTRVELDSPNGVGPAGVLEPQDVLIAFSDGVDDDLNGYVDDLVGWDFLDDDNDPYDDVQYGHGTGEARDSSAEADNGGELASCPNCMVAHLRVGTSFIADVNRFAEAVVYATDNNILVVQDALGTLNKSAFALNAIKYAYDHGTTVIASAADEAAQHHNQPSSLPYSIVVNSVTHADVADDLPGPSPVSYLQFNGCTNFSSRITLAIPSVSCSSDATGRAAGMAGLVYSAAKNAVARNQLLPHSKTGCVRVGGARCLITPNEVRQVMASGLVGGTAVSDDVNFSQTPLGAQLPTELFCPAPGCTDPFLAAPTTRPGQPGASYPARKGHDQFYGYGRVNMNRAVDAVAPETALVPSRIPPEVEVTSPNWFDMVDPAQAAMQVTGMIDSRSGTYSCRVFAAAGSYPGDDDFRELTGTSTQCDGTARTGRFEGDIATVPMADLKALFPQATQALDFTGREPGAGAQTYGGRPNTEPYGFVVKVVATSASAGTPAVPLVGQDRRQAYLHRDAAMLEGFPKQLPGDAEASPVLADVDGDNENELVVANSDGLVHVFERDGGEAAGAWPATTGAVRPNHDAAPGLGAGGVDSGHEAVLATPAVGDIDKDGTLEVVVADLNRRVRVFNHDGTLDRTLTTPAIYAGIPAQPFVNVRKDNRNRVQPGFIGSPVLADIAGGAKLEIIAASMDRHVYAWRTNGTAVDGWPVLTIDRTKVLSIDPVTHQITFKPDVGATFEQGAIVDTPAIGDLTGDGKPEIVVGTNESYAEPLNAGGLDQAAYAPLGAALKPANGRLFAIKAEGEPGGPTLNNDLYLAGWPFKVGILQAGVLPLVGEGITGNPVIDAVPCNGSTSAPRVGTMPAAGLPYVVNANGQSCYGRVNGLDRALPTSGGAGADPVFLAAFGHPAFGTVGGQKSLLVPAAGVTRAADVVLPEYQGGRDYLVAYNTSTGQLAPGWPAEVNDLQFLTGPSVADLGGLPGQEVVGGTASDDLYALGATGDPMDASWPKLTGDWTVMNPAIGPWGDGATKAVFTGTRGGRLQAYETAATACAPADWPQFHHDPANSGDARRDAISPGHPEAATVVGSELKFTATGDDLQCGTATAYEVVTSASRIKPGNLAAAAPLAAPQMPAAVGSAETIPLAGTVLRYVAVRAVDEQGNVGRPAVVDRTARAPGPAGCADDRRPFSHFVRKRITRSRVDLAGRTFEPGCARIARIRVAVSRILRGGSKCRPLLRAGALGPAGPCRRLRPLRVAGGRPWRLQLSASLPRGRYLIAVQASDTAGNAEVPSSRNRLRVRVK
ncbi:MAG: S8 family serine peptidase [Solirubrobacteraceae bacterium]